MKERPIIFSTEMVKDILDGGKNQTRRVIKPQPPSFHPYPYIKGDIVTWSTLEGGDFPMWNKHSQCPYGQVGDKLWVRETVCLACYKTDKVEDACYKEDFNREGYVTCDFSATKWTPSIYMPRWASRIQKIISLLRVERLLTITEADAKAEGFNSVDEFLTYWDIINAKRGYGTKVNPWNWVIGW